MPTQAARVGPFREDSADWFGYLGLYVPALLAWMLSPAPLFSYGVAWLGSVWVIWLSTTGRVRPIPRDRSWDEQLFRPLFLAQAKFAGYVCLTSVFYAWDASATGGGALDFRSIAAAQRYSLLGHTALVHGILATMNYRRSGEWKIVTQLPLSRKLMAAGVGAFVLGLLVAQFPGIGQFANKMRTLAALAGILGFAYALREGDGAMILLGIGLYGWILVESLLAGWKQAPIVAISVLLIALYPAYKRAVGVASLGAVVLFIAVLPAYNSTFRQLNWNQGVAAEAAAQQAIDRIESGQVDLGEQAWSFLSGRATTISMRAEYIARVPSQHPYYGFSIVQQSVMSIIPRVFWPEKPAPEQLAMERAYQHQVVSERSGASAKPGLVADAYMSAGAIGVFLICMALGAFLSVASRTAERWFGGYEIGGQLVYVALFMGVIPTSMEFLGNAVFWSFVLMGLLAVGLWLSGLLQWTGRRSRVEGHSPTVYPQGA